MRLAFIIMLWPAMGMAAMPSGLHFDAIDGGQIEMDDLRGRPLLVVNTASRCAFTAQYDDLQALADRYRDLYVLAVPSNDFRQELATGDQVAEFCALNFDLTIPMTDITVVTGASAHPFYAWLKRDYGFAPKWNFNKVLITPDGELGGTWDASTPPTEGAVTQRIEALLP